MIHTEKIIYKANGATMEGFVAWDTSLTQLRPVVLVCHTFKGQSDFENEKAIELAKLGYIGFAIDVYGKGRRATEQEEADSLLHEMDRNRPLLRKRLISTLKVAYQLPNVDKDRVAAIGFCFGGKSVLELARTGTPLSGVVSFHGVYDAPDSAGDEKINTKVLILHGWNDPLAPPKALTHLAEELERKESIWEIDAYGNTGHAFTNPMANFPDKGMLYNPLVDGRSWRRMIQFLEEIFD